MILGSNYQPAAKPEAKDLQTLCGVGFWAGSGNSYVVPIRTVSGLWPSTFGPLDDQRESAYYRRDPSTGSTRLGAI
jgi:hypothetical protein